MLEGHPVAGQQEVLAASRRDLQEPLRGGVDQPPALRLARSDVDAWLQLPVDDDEPVLRGATLAGPGGRPAHLRVLEHHDPVGQVADSRDVIQAAAHDDGARLPGEGLHVHVAVVVRVVPEHARRVVLRDLVPVLVVGAGADGEEHVVLRGIRRHMQPVHVQVRDGTFGLHERTDVLRLRQVALRQAVAQQHVQVVTGTDLPGGRRELGRVGLARHLAAPDQHGAGAGRHHHVEFAPPGPHHGGIAQGLVGDEVHARLAGRRLLAGHDGGACRGARDHRAPADGGEHQPRPAAGRRAISSQRDPPPEDRCCSPASRAAHRGR